MSKAEEYNSSILDDILNDIDPKKAEKVRKRMLLAAKIDQGIKSKGWKKIDFANSLGKRPSEITKWLSGTHNFSTETLFDIEDVLDIKLVAGDESPQEQVIKYHMVVRESVKNTDFGTYSDYFTPNPRSQKGTIIPISSYKNNNNYNSAHSA